MTTSHRPVCITRHAEQRRQERGVSTQSVYDAIDYGAAVRTADGWRFTGPDSTTAITDLTQTFVKTVLGKGYGMSHDRDGGGLSRHRRDRPGTRTDQRRPRH